MSLHAIKEAYEEMRKGNVVNEANVGKALLIHLKKIEKDVDDMVDVSGDVVHAEFEKGSAEEKKWDELTKNLYDTLSELKQLFAKI